MGNDSAPPDSDPIYLHKQGKTLSHPQTVRVSLRHQKENETLAVASLRVASHTDLFVAAAYVSAKEAKQALHASRLPDTAPMEELLKSGNRE